MTAIGIYIRGGVGSVLPEAADRPASGVEGGIAVV